MKFGKVLQQSTQMSPSAWEPYWFDYKLLKKIIKDCAQIKKEEKLQGDKLVKIKIKPSAKEDNDSIRQSQDEMNFFRTLRMEIKKIADFFIKEQAKHTSRWLPSTPASSNLRYDAVDGGRDCCTIIRDGAHEELRRVYKELLLLENFAVMNFCGISKILKKHDKWTGYATRNKFMHTILMKQPFATYEPLLHMIDRLEHIFMQATGSSIEQHDAQKSSSRRSDVAAVRDAPGSSKSATGGADDSATSGNNGSTNHAPSHTPPGASGGRRDGRRYRGAVDDSSPRSEDSVTLVRVNALRDDVRELRKIESAYDGDGEYEDNPDDASIPDDDSEMPPLRFGGRTQEEKATGILPPLPLRVAPAGTQSDSDAAAIAMLSMKDSAGLHASGLSSDGGDSAAETCERGVLSAKLVHR
ncbi:SPX domain [Phytophthora cactorum]|nr:SPX domain [Phytophthora cactorum]